MNSTNHSCTSANEARELADNAKRLANLIHQPDVKVTLLEQAAQLEREAQELEAMQKALCAGLPD